MTAATPVRAPHVSTATRLVALVDDFMASFDRTLAAPLDLLLRLWLAHGFVVSGVLKLSDWTTALNLATYEYPVGWLSPWYAAVTGLAVELGGGLLLALGLATRPAALALAALQLVAQIEYRELNWHLYSAALLLWFAVAGARGLSLDHQLGRGAGDSALPGGRLLQRCYALLDRHAAPLYRLLLRLAALLVLWTAAGQLGPELVGRSGYDPVPLQSMLSRVHLVEAGDGAPLVQVDAFGGAALALLVAAALALGAGLATRLAALVVMLLLGTEAAVAPLQALQAIELQGLGAVLLVLLVGGPGRWSLDAWLRGALHRWRLGHEQALAGLPHVVVVGAGFGGLACVRALRHAPCRITLLDQHNYHLFQPLLYQVASAGLSPADIATPVREQLRDQANVCVRMGRVSAVDAAGRAVLLGAQRLQYDYLVLATGARHSYFGKDHWEAHAPGLKRIEDGIEIRRRLLLAFELAENASDPAERRAWMNFVIVGGGPTGVELAGALAELARHGMQGEFREIDPAEARVILVQSAERLLPSFAPVLSEATRKSLTALGVEVRLNSRVEAIDGAGATVGGERIAARTVLWAAGVAASPAAEWLGAARDNAGRLKVDERLGVPGQPAIWAIGDTVASNAWNGQLVPGLAPAAKQGGAYVAKVILAQLLGRPAPAPFRYRHMGNLATIGRKSAVADFGFMKLSGPIAWWFWGVVHVLFLASLRSRLAVAGEWLWAYLTFRRSTRLITGRNE